MQGLTIIGESINDSVPSTNRLFEANDLDAILALAKSQDEAGAGYIDVNIGLRAPELMDELVRKIQSVTRKPLSIDSPDFAIVRAGLEAYDFDAAEGAKPILNSISPLRPEMFELYAVCPYKAILLASEQMLGGEASACTTAEDTYAAGKEMITQFRKACGSATNDDCILDPGIAPIGSDHEGNIQRLMAAMQMFADDDSLQGFHASVGLSNFTVQLPPKRKSGGRVKSELESAFLTRAIPLGMDHVIGSVKRRYEQLPDDAPAMACFDECMQLQGFDVIMRVQAFYNS